MKAMKVMLPCCLVIVLILSGFNEQQSPKIEGAWQLVSVKMVYGDSIQVFPGDWNGSQMKMWTNKHFSFVGVFKDDTATYNGYGGGTYKLSGNRYDETVIYHTTKDIIGQTLKMIIEIKNDTLYQTWPVDDKGKTDPDHYTIEKYVRL